MLFIIEIVVFCLRNENKEIKENYFLKGIIIELKKGN